MAVSAEHATVHIKWIDSEQLNEENVDEMLGDVSGILVPGGFGGRGIDGKIVAIHYARTHKIPFLGLCLGMQLAIVEYARNVVRSEGCTQYRTGSRHYPSGDCTDAGSGTISKISAEPCVWDLIHVFWTKPRKLMSFMVPIRSQNVTDIVTKSTMITVRS